MGMKWSKSGIFISWARCSVFCGIMLSVTKYTEVDPLFSLTVMRGGWLEAGSIFPSFSDNLVALEELNRCGLVSSMQAGRNCSTYHPSCFSCLWKLKTVTPQEFPMLQIPIPLVCLCFLTDLYLQWQGFSDQLIWILGGHSVLSCHIGFILRVVINGNYCSSCWLTVWILL